MNGGVYATTDNPKSVTDCHPWSDVQPNLSLPRPSGAHPANKIAAESSASLGESVAFIYPEDRGLCIPLLLFHDPHVVWMRRIIENRNCVASVQFICETLQVQLQRNRNLLISYAVTD